MHVITILTFHDWERIFGFGLLVVGGLVWFVVTRIEGLFERLRAAFRRSPRT